MIVSRTVVTIRDETRGGFGPFFLGTNIASLCVCGGGGYGRNEVNVLFNDGINTFYLWLYDVIYMVKDHLNSKRGNPMPPHGLLFPFSSKGYFICIIPHTGWRGGGGGYGAHEHKMMTFWGLEVSP